jgi:hypothetical protein
VLFARTGLRRPAPFIDPRLLVEIRWPRSAVGVLVQQVTLFSVLVAVSLHLTGVAGLSGTVTGLLVQIPSLTGATRSPAGQRGTGLGLFNMMRLLLLSFAEREPPGTSGIPAVSDTPRLRPSR